MTKKNKSSDGKMTAKEIRFANEYISNGRNATRAYLKVQPNSSEANARARGSEWCAKRNISDYIKEKTIERLNASNLTADDVINELIQIGFKTTKGISKKIDKLTGTIEKHDEYESTPMIEDRLRAIDMLAKMIGLYDKNKRGVSEEEKLAEGLKKLGELFESN